MLGILWEMGERVRNRREKAVVGHGVNEKNLTWLVPSTERDSSSKDKASMRRRDVSGNSCPELMASGDVKVR